MTQAQINFLKRLEDYLSKKGFEIEKSEHVVIAEAKRKIVLCGGIAVICRFEWFVDIGSDVAVLIEIGSNRIFRNYPVCLLMYSYGGIGDGCANLIHLLMRDVAEEISGQIFKQ